jgi:hypothetical protein
MGTTLLTRLDVRAMPVGTNEVRCFATREDFRRFIARCQLDAAQRAFVVSEAEDLWGPDADASPAMAGRSGR